MRGLRKYLCSLGLLVLLIFLPTIGQADVAITYADLDILTQNAIEEASVDGPEGMADVTTVVLNRIKQRQKNVREIIYEPDQFSWTLLEGRQDLKPSDYGPTFPKVKELVKETILKWVMDNDYRTNGATHYARTDWIEAGRVEWADSPRMHFLLTRFSHSYFIEMPCVFPRKVKKRVNTGIIGDNV